VLGPVCKHLERRDPVRQGLDGDIHAGVPIPSPRFTDNLNGTITDNLWLKNANCFRAQSWANALHAANTLTSGRRMLAYKDGRDVRTESRYGVDHTRRLSRARCRGGSAALANAGTRQ